MFNDFSDLPFLLMMSPSEIFCWICLASSLPTLAIGISGSGVYSVDLYQLCPKGNTRVIKGIAADNIESNESPNMYSDGCKTPEVDMCAAYVVPDLKVSKGIRFCVHTRPGCHSRVPVFSLWISPNTPLHFMHLCCFEDVPLISFMRFLMFTPNCLVLVRLSVLFRCTAMMRLRCLIL